MINDKRHNEEKLLFSNKSNSDSCYWSEWSEWSVCDENTYLKKQTRECVELKG